MQTSSPIDSVRPAKNINDSFREDELFLIDIIYFLKNSWKIIFLSGAGGLVIAVSYLGIAPKQYAAIAQISMAKISVINANEANFLGVNIEDPPALLARLSSPTSFTPAVQSACGLGGKKDAALLLMESIKLSSPKGVASIVELKTIGSSPEIAAACAMAIFELIKITQSQIVAPYIEEAKMRLQEDERRLQNVMATVAKADKSGQVSAATYLSTRDEIRHLLDETTFLKNLVSNNQSRETRLIAPVYASDIPILPKKWRTLMAGLFGGAALGLFLSWWLQRSVRYGIKLQK